MFLLSREDDSFSGDTEIDITERGLRKRVQFSFKNIAVDWKNTIRYIINWQ